MRAMLDYMTESEARMHVTYPSAVVAVLDSQRLCLCAFVTNKSTLRYVML